MLTAVAWPIWKRLNSIRENQALSLDAMDSLVTRIKHSLVVARFTNRPKLPIDERDQSVYRATFLTKGSGEILKHRRPS